MSGDVHVRFCERLGGRFPGATRLVILCADEPHARGALETVRCWMQAHGLRLHPDKTHLPPVASRNPMSRLIFSAI